MIIRLAKNQQREGPPHKQRSDEATHEKPRDLDELDTVSAFRSHGLGNVHLGRMMTILSDPLQHIDAVSCGRIGCEILSITSAWLEIICLGRWIVASRLALEWHVASPSGH